MSIKSARTHLPTWAHCYVPDALERDIKLSGVIDQFIWHISMLNYTRMNTCPIICSIDVWKIWHSCHIETAL